ncbi:unnamed protein product [Effrenium voratum]|nr:unnamed protein product [Effrenium voratum]
MQAMASDDSESPSSQRMARLYALMNSDAPNELSLRLPQPKPSVAPRLEEQLRHLEDELQKTKRHKEVLETEKDELWEQLQSQSTATDLRHRVRSMLEEQKRLVDQLQAEIAQEMTQLQTPASSQRHSFDGQPSMAFRPASALSSSVQELASPGQGSLQCYPWPAPTESPREAPEETDAKLQARRPPAARACAAEARASPSQFSSECLRASPSYAQQLRRVSVESATEPAEAPDETDIQQLQARWLPSAQASAAAEAQFSSESLRASPSYAQQLRRVSVESAMEPAEAPDETDIQQLRASPGQFSSESSQAYPSRGQQLRRASVESAMEPAEAPDETDIQQLRASPGQFSSESSRAYPSRGQQLRRASVDSAMEPAEAPDETDIQQLQARRPASPQAFEARGRPGELRSEPSGASPGSQQLRRAFVDSVMEPAPEEASSPLQDGRPPQASAAVQMHASTKQFSGARSVFPSTSQQLRRASVESALESAEAPEETDGPQRQSEIVNPKHRPPASSSTTLCSPSSKESSPSTSDAWQSLRTSPQRADPAGDGRQDVHGRRLEVSNQWTSGSTPCSPSSKGSPQFGPRSDSPRSAPSEDALPSLQLPLSPRSSDSSLPASPEDEPGQFGDPSRSGGFTRMGTPPSRKSPASPGQSGSQSGGFTRMTMSSPASHSDAPPISPQDGRGREPPLPPPTPSEDADSESEGEGESPPASKTPVEVPLKSKAPVEGKAGEAQHEEKVKVEESWKKRQLAEGVILLQRWNSQRTHMEMKLSNKKLADLKFTVNIAKSVNLDFAEPAASKGAQTCTVTAPAAADTKICQVGQVDASSSAQVRLSFNWVPQPVQRKELEGLVKGDQTRRADLAAKLKAAGITAKLGSAVLVEEACAKSCINRFVDVEFMPTDASLFKDPSKADNPVVVWKRPSEFCSGPVQIFSDDVQPSDINQGCLGDCWFLAALAAMAEQPRLIQGLLAKNKAQHNQWGVYEVSCFKNGQPTTIIVDDFFPCSPNTGKPCYAHANAQDRGANELWVLILEKAWAKLHGSYQQLEGGAPYRALMDLLGTAGKEYSIKHEQQPGGLIAENKFFEMLRRYDRRRYLMVAGTPGVDTLTKGDRSGSDQHDQLSGLVPGHAYTLLSVQEACGQRLLQLRNVWGDHEWTGDWSDKSPLWTPKMRQAFKPSFNEHDGEFWMCEEDFQKHFSSLSVAFYSDTWAVSRIPVRSTGRDICGLVSIRVAAEAKGFITLLQTDIRVVGAPPYTQFSFALYGPVSDGQPKEEILRSPLWPVRELVEEIPPEKPLAPGEYWVAIFSPDKVKDRPFTLMVELDEGGKDAGSKSHVASTIAWDESLRKSLALASCASSGARKAKMGPANTLGTWLPDGGYALAASCKGGNKDIAMTFDFSRCKGLALRNGSDGKAEMTFRAKDGLMLAGELQPVASKKSFAVSASFQESR